MTVSSRGLGYLVLSQVTGVRISQPPSEIFLFSLSVFIKLKTLTANLFIANFLLKTKMIIGYCVLFIMKTLLKVKYIKGSCSNFHFLSIKKIRAL